MILRMTASCNNRCFFCSVDDEISAGAYRPTADLLAEVDRVPPHETVDIFGGEPTIDPSFWQVFERAVSTGRRVSLATNARIFGHRRIARRLRELGGDRVVVRTTLMGPNAELHDRLNAAANAFRQTLAGIENLSSEGIEVRTNIVILKENLDAVIETALVACSAGSFAVKLSGPIRTRKFRGSVPDPVRVREVIAQAIPMLNACGVSIRLEKLPLCVAGEHVDILQPEEPAILGMNPYFQRADPCRRCAMSGGCPGGELGALEQFGDGWMTPFDAVPPHSSVQVHWRDIDSFDPEEHVRFVQLDQADAGLHELAALALAVNHFHHRHPGITVI